MVTSVTVLDSTGATQTVNTLPSLPLQSSGVAAMTQVSVTGTSGAGTLLAAARTGAAGVGRISIMVLNEGSTAIRIGTAAALTVSTSMLLNGGQSATLQTTSAIYAYTTGAAESVSVVELY